MRLQSSMMKGQPGRGDGRVVVRLRLTMRYVFALSLLLFAASTISATPLHEYHKRIKQAVTALDSLAHSESIESVSAYSTRDVETIASVRTLLPETEVVESNGESFKVDNAWLHQELDHYASDKSMERYSLLKRIIARLSAIEERIAELEKPAVATSESKGAAGRKLSEILLRPEYVRKVQQESAITRLIRRAIKWILSFIPKPKPASEGGTIFTTIAQWVVIALAVAVLAFVAKLFLPRMLGGRRPGKKTKAKARIVLGERLEPDQSARDLLLEAEALARRGDLRAAIRKAYVALLVEMGDRKIISLAQYKTNRDYLRAVREVEPLYRNVKQLTDSFELHWYGLAQATETDWLAFRAAYEQALLRT